MLDKRFFYNFSTYFPSLRLSDIESFGSGISQKDFLSWWKFHKEREIGQKEIDQIFQDFSLIDRKSIDQLFIDSNLYPSFFLKFKNPPLCFNYKGDLNAFLEPRMSIVGSRSLRESVYEWAEIHLAKFISMQKTIAIVSGAAIGADQLAHELAVRNKKKSISYLPSGILNIYPSSFANKMAEIVDLGGLVLSSFPPTLEIRKYCFHQRNQWIAASSDLLFVLQARRGSGTMVTANFARTYAKGIACLPGDVLDSNFWGTNDLLAEGAHLVRDREDLVSIFNLYKNRVDAFV